MGWIKVAETLLNPFGDDDEVLKYHTKFVQAVLYNSMV